MQFDVTLGKAPSSASPRAVALRCQVTPRGSLCDTDGKEHPSTLLGVPCPQLVVFGGILMFVSVNHPVNFGANINLRTKHCSSIFPAVREILIPRASECGDHGVDHVRYGAVIIDTESLS